MSVKVASVAQSTPAEWKCTETCGTLKEKIELYMYLKDEYLSMSSAQRQHLYELKYKAGFGKGKKPNDSKKQETGVAML